MNKLAQAVPGDPASPTAPGDPASPASPTAPTTPDSTTKPAIQPPPQFNIASGAWAWVTSAYNTPTVGYLNVIANMINTLMQYATNGQHNLAKDQNNIASLDPSGQPSIDGINVIKLAQLFYKTFLNKGQAITPTPAQITQWADMIANSQPLLALSKLNPTGPAAQQMRLPDTFRQTIRNNLGYIKQYNPIRRPPQG